MAAPQYNVITFNKDNVEIFPANINMDNILNIIHKQENPHPVVGIAVVASSIIILYLLYILFVKRCVSGIWFGKLGDYPDVVKYKIKHNPFTDNIVVSLPHNGEIANGELIGDTLWIKLGDKRIAGIFITRNKIIWVDSKDVWNNVGLF